MTEKLLLLIQYTLWWTGANYKTFFPDASMYHIPGATVVISVFASLDCLKCWRSCIFLSSTQKNDFFKSCFLSSTLGHRSSPDMDLMKTKENRRKNGTGIIHIKCVEMSTLGQKVGNHWKRLGLPPTDQSAGPIHHAFGPATVCTVVHRCYWWKSQAEPAPDPFRRVRSLVPQISPNGVRLNQSVTAVNPFHTFLRENYKSAA